MFLEIKSHDNDFSHRFIEALTEIWNLVSDQHINKFRPDTRIVEVVFKDLIDKGIILPALIRLVALKSVESSICWEITKASIVSKAFEQPEWVPGGVGFCTIEHYTNYFSDISLELHDTDAFTYSNENGEHCWLNLDTGDAGYF